MIKKIVLPSVLAFVIWVGSGLTFSAFAGSGQPPKFWKDLLQVKPTTEWNEVYGWSDASFLAHGQWVNRQVLDNFIKVQAEAMAAMKAKVDELEARLNVLDPNDPNEVGDE